MILDRAKVLTISFTFLAVLATKPIWGQPIGDGFLGLDIISGWHGGTSEIQGERVGNNVAGVSIALIGASPGYDAFTKILFSSNLIYIRKHYLGLSDYLKERELDPFSFFEFSIQYFAQALWTNAILLVGLGIGHMGYNSPSFKKNPYTIFISPSACIRWFLSGYLALLAEVDVPIGTYRRNATKLWHVRIRNEIIFEPGGFIYNPIVYTIFVALGWQFEYVSLRTKTNKIPADLKKIKPYFRFTFLY